VLTVRPANREDLEGIAEIQRLSPEASAWTPDSDACSVAICEGAVAGFLVTRQIAPDEFEVLNMAVHPQYRRCGIGREMLRQAVRGGRWFLEVRESNLPAIRIYKSLGFESAGRRENYYSSPAEAAIVMSIHS